MPIGLIYHCDTVVGEIRMITFWIHSSSLPSGYLLSYDWIASMTVPSKFESVFEERSYERFYIVISEV